MDYPEDTTKGYGHPLAHPKEYGPFEFCGKLGKALGHVVMEKSRDGFQEIRGFLGDD